jgi:hypothetical protein
MNNQKTATQPLNTLTPGERFKFGSFEWEALDGGSSDPANVQQNGRLCVMHKIMENMPFDENDSNDWRGSTARKYLNGKFFDELSIERMTEGDILNGEIGKEMLEYISDLTADDGATDYGKCADRVFLLSAEDYRRNRYNISNADDWWWLITPWATPYSGNSYYVRIVYSRGALSYSGAYGGSIGLRPALYLKSDISVSKTSG